MPRGSGAEHPRKPLGCVIPPNTDCYWVGNAGPRLLKEHPIPTNLKTLIEEARVYCES